MTLIKSISGIRGTIGGHPSEGLSPIDVVKFTAAFATFLKERLNKDSLKLVVGRDARVSGEMVNHMVVGTLMGMGADVIDTGLSTTPTVEMAVTQSQADGGIILTASHNPAQWNALKLLNEKGEFINAKEGARVLELAENENQLNFCQYQNIGTVEEDHSFIDRHIDAVLNLDLVDVDAIRSANFKVALDCVNSTGGIALPRLLKRLGVNQVEELYCDPTGLFPHNPEPLPENLTEIADLIKKTSCDLGFVVDPDVDRLAIITEKGEMFGEEYTLVAVADYILKHNSGNTVSNLSSTRALRDVTENHNQSYFASAVGEVNVVEMMKKNNAVIGGEGNGGIIYPEIHYGRDALVGIALFLTHLAKENKKCSELRASYPNYFISKNKIELKEGVNVDDILEKMKDKYANENVNDIDGVKIDFPTEWVHLRKSNTEPIIRIYAESNSEDSANGLAERIMKEISELI
ncbi:MAG: phosphoglucosamine mutase [Hyphomicrobiales bacterium]